MNYAYDFGSTTELVIKVVSDYPLAVKEKILLLSRNNPLKFMCDNCGKKAATSMCTVHWEETDDRFFCEDCAEIHEEECKDAEYSMASIVNSPRMGACAYEGGVIDVERD